jgi:hypothetical protein
MSKVHVVYDRDGNIAAIGVPLPPRFDFSGPAFGPQAGKDQHTAELEVPSEHAELQLAQLGQHLKVDIAKRKLVAKG